MFWGKCGAVRAQELRFCENCGNLNCEVNVPRADEPADEEILIKRYFDDGYKYSTILNFLKYEHGINYSLRTLKRRIQTYGLKKGQNVGNAELAIIIQREIKGPSSRLGYSTEACWVY